MKFFLLIFFILPMLGMFLLETPSSGDASRASSVSTEELGAGPCERCHSEYVKDLKEWGGKHQFQCRGCHEVFHVRNPKNYNVRDILPQCSTCHSAPHPGVEDQCLDCHQNVHAVAKLPPMEKLQGKCGSCHEGPARDIRQNASKHTELGCLGCHSEEHGQIPSCQDCHSGHYRAQSFEACLSCHPAHRPLSAPLSIISNPLTCKSCHRSIYARWANTSSKHGELNCAVCHAHHGERPGCVDCHKPPHEPAMLAGFQNCNGCHFDPHDLAMK